MKTKILTFLVISFLSVLAVSGQNSTKKINPVGSWKFEAPYAPEGYTTGTIVIGFSEKKHTATIAFSGLEEKLSGGNVKVENDSLIFSVFVEGNDVVVSLKFEDSTKMSGKAVYSGGELPLTLTKNTKSTELK